MKCPSCKRPLKAVQGACLCGWIRPDKGDTVFDHEAAAKRAGEEHQAASHQRWLDRGSPTKAQSAARIKAIQEMPTPTNLERAHLIVAQDTPVLQAIEWAREYISKRGAIE